MVVVLLLVATAAFAAGLPTGQIVDRVACDADPNQTYALYLPSNFSATRIWPVIFAFDPRARGRIAVERYQAAAEMYGYIVAGSNNSQNGSWAGSMTAVQAMTTDVSRRFPVESKRVYTAGMSGGARVAMGVALATDQIAGVIASSAGYPDSKPRETVPFVVFGTAGTEDFNYLEMRALDRALTSPHRLAIFEGGHVWLSSDLAVEAVEWLEVQAMKSGRAARDEQRLDRIFAKRAGVAFRSDKDACLALEALAADFEGLRDVTTLVARAAALRRDKRVRDALKQDREEDAREQRDTDELLQLESHLSDAGQRQTVLAMLRDRWKRMAAAADAPKDSAQRRIARRMIRGFASWPAERTKDADYRKILEQHRPARPPAAVR